MASKLIMIVEDSPTDRKIAETVCSENGYRIVTVTEGDKVLSTVMLSLKVLGWRKLMIKEMLSLRTQKENGKFVFLILKILRQFA